MQHLRKLKDEYYPNKNLKDGSIIKIIVTGEDGDSNIYKIKNKGYIYDRIKALFMLVILILLILFIIAVPVCGDYLMKGFSALLNTDIFDTDLISSFYSIKRLKMLRADLSEFR